MSYYGTDGITSRNCRVYIRSTLFYLSPYEKGVKDEGGSKGADPFEALSILFSFSYLFAGKLIVTVVPFPLVLWKRIVPLYLAAMLKHIIIPNPVPLLFNE